MFHDLHCTNTCPGVLGGVAETQQLYLAGDDAGCAGTSH